MSIHICNTTGYMIEDYCMKNYGMVGLILIELNNHYFDTCHIYINQATQTTPSSSLSLSLENRSTLVEIDGS